MDFHDTEMIQNDKNRAIFHVILKFYTQKTLKYEFKPTLELKIYSIPFF